MRVCHAKSSGLGNIYEFLTNQDMTNPVEWSRNRVMRARSARITLFLDLIPPSLGKGSKGGWGNPLLLFNYDNTPHFALIHAMINLCLTSGSGFCLLKTTARSAM